MVATKWDHVTNSATAKADADAIGVLRAPNVINAHRVIGAFRMANRVSVSFVKIMH